jgi:hypothetical protein
MQPIDHPELRCLAPVCQQYDHYGEEGVNDKMNKGETKVDRGMPHLILFVLQLGDWYGTLNDPEYQQPATSIAPLSTGRCSRVSKCLMIASSIACKQYTKKNRRIIPAIP